MKHLDPKYLVDILNANVDNDKLSDAEFRQFVRNSVPLYEGSTETTVDDESTG